VATKQRKRVSGGRIVIDDIALLWTVRSEPQKGTADGDIGLRLQVETEGKAHRLLILEYPFEKRQKIQGRILERTRVDPQSLVADIRLAMEAGWDPHSRGRPFIFQLFEDGDAIS
jgi:hypothetical protein